MYGFMNRQVWMWVITIPAVIFAAVAVMGDSLEIVLKVWWVAGPILLTIATLIWFSLGPAKSKEQKAAEKAAGKPAERAKFDSADLPMRLIMTPLLTLAALLAV